jgi:hypothetical protein
MPRSVYLPQSNPTLTLRRNTPQGLEVWVWETPNGKGGVFYNAAAFWGKQSKPLWMNYFRDVFEQEKKISDTIKSYQAAQDAKAQARAERSQAVHGYKVGDILSGSWGYDQTQNSYYEVVGVPTPKVVVLREIGQKLVRQERGANYVVPVPGSFKGPLMKKIPGPGGRVRIESFLSVGKWDGSPDYETPSEFGH